MQAFLQSAFLQALAYGLFASIWQMALLWLATNLLLTVCKLSSAQKFNIAFLAQLSGFGLFIYTCIHNYTTENIIIGATQTAVISNINVLITELMPYLATLYLCMLTVNLIRFVVCYNNTQKLKKHDLKKMPVAGRIFVQHVSELFSLHRKVRIYLSGKITSPLTLGYFKPVILIPFAVINHLTTEQMEAVILHELAHIRRADYLLFILQNLVEKIFFFNIFSRMLGDIIERERENACDDWVLQFRYNSMHYAEALFKLGRLKTLHAFAMPLTGRKDGILLSRIKRLLHNAPNKNAYNVQTAFLSLFSVMIATAIMLSPSATNKQIITSAANSLHTSTGKNQNKVVQPSAFNNVSPVIATAKQVKQKSLSKKFAYALPAEKKQAQSAIKQFVNNYTKEEILAEKQNYLLQVKQSLDSLRQALPQYKQALDAQVLVTPEVMQKAVSYQNFKQIENMLAASGDSIHVSETKISEKSYKKQITIEATDKDGNKHVYCVIVELYQ